MCVGLKFSEKPVFVEPDVHFSLKSLIIVFIDKYLSNIRLICKLPGENKALEFLKNEQIRKYSGKILKFQCY